MLDALWALPCASLVSLGQFPFRSLAAPPAVPQLESGLPEGRGSGAPC